MRYTSFSPFLTEFSVRQLLSKIIMVITRIILIFPTLLIAVAAVDFPFPSAEYQHEIIYSSNDELISETATNPAILRFAASTHSDRGGFRPAGNLFATPVHHAVNLFTPNTIQQPAETPGQIENYRKALEEDAREADREQNDITAAFGGGIQRVEERRPKSYVSVQVGEGGKGYDYGYRI